MRRSRSRCRTSNAPRAAAFATLTGLQPDPVLETPGLPPEHVRAVGQSFVARDLIAGRVTLSEAAARFRVLERLAALPDTGGPGDGYVRPGPWSCAPAD